ncbi:hypothetical protein XA68_10691 [Ophiocordyceps unilateralis]|uniref:Uncharacterized protein n=1 Tax=Ophiocordyceps unilateralis TaxID=268505 RepID=A0A2A9PI72_OPHUN|nr:hypothetical protein XA68_10691 [Ophiocordyceps unilateralis]
MPGPFVSSPTRLPSSPARHGTLPNLWSGRDFGNVVPPAPGLAGVKPQDSFFKQLSVPDIELSEASLGTGFSFEFKKPPRPGQFFGRPPFSAPDASKQVHAGSHVEVSQKHPQTPVVPAVRAAAVHRGGPLLLDELSLPASKAISTTPPQRDRPSKLMGTAFSGKSHVPLVDALSPRAPDESSTPSSESRRLPTTSVSTKKSQQETNDDILSNMLPKAVVAETSPGHHLAESSRGRVDKQEVNARQRIACPSSNDFATRERPNAATGGSRPCLDSEDHKHRRRTEDERKRKAMQHVAQYWNECMQILEDEKNQVNQDMECLQHQLQRQGAKLSESRSMLTQKQHELECAHSHRRQLEEEGLQIKEENRRLSDEAQSLRGQLAESKAQATRLQERHRQIRHRLNEAIQEQQALFKRSKSFYEDSMAALRKDKEERDSYKGRMDAALETSHRKREEMKGCFDEFRDRMERESRLKEETISELRSRIEEQEESLRHERDLAESLRRQVDLQQSSQDMVGVIASNVESFLRNYAAEHGEQQGTALVIESISERLDALMQHMQNSDAGGHSQTTLTQAIQGVEELISRQVVTMVADLASNQGRMEETLLSLGRTCGIQVEKIRDYLTYQSDEVYNLDNAAKEARHEFRGSLQSLQSEVRTARETCQQIKEAFEDVTQTELVVRQEEMLKRQADLDVTLAGRDERVGELEQQLRSLSQAYAEEIASLATKSPTGDDRNLQSKVDGVVADFRSSLEEGFLQEKNRSEEHLRQTQTAMAALEGQLRAVVDKLEVVRSSTPQGQGMGNVEQGSASASQLQQQAQHLEKQTKAAEQLRDRWQRDINAVDILRVQLKELQRRVPQLERFDSTLGKMAHMNEILHSTAQYLTCERKWARQQIDETAGVESRPDGPEDGDGSQPQQAKPDTQFTFGLFTVDKEVATGSQHGEASSRRKVTVYSPAGTQLSPSPPPSIEQEQVRRRGATQPRSILKLAATSSLEPGRVEQHAMRAAVRPVMGKDGATAASAVVEQIRAELLPSEGSQLAWSLPSVADFERDGLYTLVGGDRNPVNKAKRRLEVGDDVANTTIKRPRPETTGSVAGRTAERESDTE